MTKLDIDGIDAPEEIKTELRSLSVDFDFSRMADKGQNGYLFFGTNKITGTSVAIKFYDFDGKCEYHAEPKQLSCIRSCNVLPIYDAAAINKWAYFITPSCANGDLDKVMESTFIGNLTALDYSCQILSGLSHLHCERLLHRDLKPSNIYLTDENIVKIGDFGSVKKLPEGKQYIPASGHSLLYRPPESIERSSYGLSGDIYQVGLVLYQLLGGHLPYDGVKWLSRRQLQRYECLSSDIDKCAFIDQCIKDKITTGKLLDLSSLPVWVPDSLKKIVKKACCLDEAKRFQTASAFMARLHEVRPTVLDWRYDDRNPLLVMGDISYRVRYDGGQVRVQKQKGARWRNDNSFSGTTIEELVRQVSKKVKLIN